MNREIEEMGKVMCSEFRTSHCGNDCDCANEEIAQRLYNAGYRKSTDVAREILQEVRQLLLNMVLANAMGETYDLEGKFAELQKKYESEGEE